MKTEKIENLVNELCEKQVDYVAYDGKKSQTNLIFKDNRTILEQIIRQHILDNRDEKIGNLEAKVFVYEEMIAKSTFAPMLIVKEEVAEPIEETNFRREMVFTQTQIEHLQHKVFKIVGEGEVMMLFNEMLGISAG